MTHFSPIRKLTEHFSMVVGLMVAALVILWIERPDNARAGILLDYARSDPFSALSRIEPVPLAVPDALSAEEIDAARVAWQYFESFTNPNTGLANSVENFPSGTMWDQGSYLLAILSAERLGLLSRNASARRIANLLSALKEMPLVEGQLPNKVYNTDSLQMTFYNNAVTTNGLGWSALDMARLSVALFAAQHQHPEFTPEIAAIQDRWNVTRLAQNGELWGSARDANGNLEYLQEGRLGYEEYGARGAALLGLNTARAADWRYQAISVSVENVPLLVDFRDKENSNASNYMLSEPFLMTAFEFGLDPETLNISTAIYHAQVARADRTGILTAVSEDNIDQDPYFLYYNIYANDEKWMPINPDGKAYPELATVSTKAAFGWHALFETEYTQTLVDHIGVTRHETRGWLSGTYEVDGAINDVATANTNAMVLSAIHYQAFGPLIPAILRDKS